MATIFRNWTLFRRPFIQNIFSKTSIANQSFPTSIFRATLTKKLCVNDKNFFLSLNTNAFHSCCVFNQAKDKDEKVKMFCFQNPIKWAWVRWNLFLFQKSWDPSFSLKDFMVGSKQALCTVLTHLSENKHKELDGLINEKEIAHIVAKLAILIGERSLWSLNPTDIYVAIPFRVVMTTDAGKKLCAIDVMYVAKMDNSNNENVASTLLQLGARMLRDYDSKAHGHWFIEKLDLRKIGEHALKS